jgi:hypothetical protein
MLTVVPVSVHRVIVILLLLAVTAGCDGDSERPNRLFGYDTGAALSVRTKSSSQEGNLRVIRLTYASPLGGRVPAIVVVPRGDGPFAGLIVQHGLPGTEVSCRTSPAQTTRKGRCRNCPPCVARDG